MQAAHVYAGGVISRMVTVVFDETSSTSAAGSVPNVTATWSDIAISEERRKLVMVARNLASGPPEDGLRQPPQLRAMLSSKKVNLNDATDATGAPDGCTAISPTSSPASADGDASSNAASSPCWKVTRVNDATVVSPMNAEIDESSLLRAPSAPKATAGALSITTVIVPTPRSGALLCAGRLPAAHRPFTMHVRPTLHVSHQKRPSTFGCGT